MKVLGHDQINQKIKRLAFEIVENNFGEPSIILAGINNNGTHFAKMLSRVLNRISDIEFVLTKIKLNPADPINHPITVGLPMEELEDKVIIVVDDVANTGRTIFYACKPLMDFLPKKVEVAVLVDRKHKSFPIAVDYVGLSLATTLMENIDVQILNTKKTSVFLT